MQTRFVDSAGAWIPRLDVTATDEFWYRELPGLPAADRIGIASEQGTIPRERAVVSLTREGHDWRATLTGRYHSEYRDWNSALAIATNRHIPSNTIWDINASIELGKHWRVTVGATDLLNKEPSYSDVSAAGFDPSQDALDGRAGYLLISGTF